MKRLCLAALAVLLTPAPTFAQQFTRPGPITHLSAPVPLDTTGRFLDAADAVGQDMIIAGQPTEQALRELHIAGVTTVVNLRTPQEMATEVPFDEPAVVASLGMRYVSIPIRGTAAFPFTPAAREKFAEAVRGATGRVLLHCTIGWRASHMWAAYLIGDRGVPVDVALANARAINLMSSHHMPDGKRQPVEDLLGRGLTPLQHP